MDKITLDKTDLIILLDQAAEIGARRAITAVGFKFKDMISNVRPTTFSESGA